MSEIRRDELLVVLDAGAASASAVAVVAVPVEARRWAILRLEIIPEEVAAPPAPPSCCRLCMFMNMSSGEGTPRACGIGSGGASSWAMITGAAAGNICRLCMCE